MYYYVQLSDTLAYHISSVPLPENLYLAVTERPSEYHYYDINTNMWIFNLNEALNDIRKERNRLLEKCDWTVLPDSPLTNEVKQQWIIYRQALRDLPEQVVDYETFKNLVWPTPPTEGSEYLYE